MEQRLSTSSWISDQPLRTDLAKYDHTALSWYQTDLSPRDSLPAQPSQAFPDAQDSFLDSRSRGASEGERQASHASTLEEREKQTAGILRERLEAAMSDDVPYFTHTPSIFTKTPSNVFSIPSKREHSAEHGEEWGHLEEADRPAYFIREFQNINSQRENIQFLRVQARDERNRMKTMRKRLHRVGADVLEAAGRLHSAENEKEEIVNTSQMLKEVLTELEAQTLLCDSIEDDLIPAEWKLKESERELYEHILGIRAFERQESDNDFPQPVPLTLENVPPTDAEDSDMPPLHESTIQESLAGPEIYALEARSRLANLEREYEELLEDVEMQAAVGEPLDDYSQYLLDIYPQRRQQLLRELADLTAETDRLEISFDLSSPASIESDALFRLDQFNGQETDSKPQQSQTSGEEILHLQEDYDVRNDDIQPFLAQPILDDLSHPAKSDQSIPPHSIVEYSSLKWDLPEQDYETLSSFVSVWILRCIQSSWLSFLRFAIGSFEGKISNKSIQSLVRRSWFGEKVFPTPRLGGSEDPETLKSSLLLDDELPIPSPNTATIGEQQHQTSRSKEAVELGIPGQTF